MILGNTDGFASTKPVIMVQGSRMFRLLPSPKRGTDSR
jgi:hypothetical protein